jgi:hypothetical protein
MRHEDLPQRWKNKIYSYLLEKGSEYSPKYKRFSVYDFSDNFSLKISFEDGSYAFFKDAFYWIDEEAKEVAVFTEHCGYHLFNLPEILIETVHWEGNIIKTDDYRTE